MKFPLLRGATENRVVYLGAQGEGVGVTFKLWGVVDQQPSFLWLMCVETFATCGNA